MADQTNVVSGNGEQSRMITLVTSDGERFEVSEAAARLSQVITHFIEDDCADGNIPLPNVTAKLLAKVLEYCNMHAAVVSCEADRDSSNAAASNEGELKSFDAGFIDVDQATLYDLLMAANFLEVKGLLDLACQKVAEMIRGKTPEQIRETFGIENDLTPEKEEEIRRENRWVFDD